MSYYAWNSSTPLYSFENPTGPAAGEYSLLIGGVVVPLIVSQVVTGKVLFTEKYGSGEPNGTGKLILLNKDLLLDLMWWHNAPEAWILTRQLNLEMARTLLILKIGAYELDLSQINNFAAAWRPLTGLQTNVFCSAGLTLPDKVGRQITIGGWAGQSNFGVRLYWPDGSAGVPGVNDWEEDPTILSLQVPRWYASAMIMANGSILSKYYSSNVPNSWARLTNLFQSSEEKLDLMQPHNPPLKFCPLQAYLTQQLSVDTRIQQSICPS
jgi:hypothetical protein